MKASYLLLDLVLTELEKDGILSNKECDFIKEYVHVNTSGRDEENAGQYLLQVEEIWSIIDDRVTICDSQDENANNLPWNEDTTQKLLST